MPVGDAPLAAFSAWWLGGADDRRISSACDTWLEQRNSLRAVLGETEEAVGRAEAAGSTMTSQHVNNLDTTIAAIQRWNGLSPEVRASLNSGDGASRLERGAASAFGFLQSGLSELRRLLDEGDPAELSNWVPEVPARFQIVDDVCLAAARSRNL